MNTVYHYVTGARYSVWHIKRKLKNVAVARRHAKRWSTEEVTLRGDLRNSGSRFQEQTVILIRWSGDYARTVKNGNVTVKKKNVCKPAALCFYLNIFGTKPSSLLIFKIDITGNNSLLRDPIAACTCAYLGISFSCVKCINSWKRETGFNLMQLRIKCIPRIRLFLLYFVTSWLRAFQSRPLR